MSKCSIIFDLVCHIYNLNLKYMRRPVKNHGVIEFKKKHTEKITPLKTEPR